MDDPKALFVYGALAFVGLATVRKWLAERNNGIPVLGSKGLSSYRDAWTFILRAPALIQQGYDQHPDGVFRVARLYRWEYIVCGTKLVKEVGNAPETVLSFHEGIEESVQSRITMGRELVDNHYHLAAIRTSLTRNLHARFPDVRDEIVCAFNDVLQLSGSDFKPIYVLPSTMNIVARISNRLFVGLPLCRNSEYLSNNVQFTVDVMRSAKRITLLPPFLRPILGPLISGKNRCFNKALKLLGPLVAERIALDDARGEEWEGRPNDMISWLLEIARGSDRNVEGIVLRILSTNMAAIHTTSMAFTNALYTLAAYPASEYFLPMRAEAERVVTEEGNGWTKAALDKMFLIDSFLRESQRVYGNGPVGMARRVVAKEGFRLSNGTVLPYGAQLSVAAGPAQSDPANYENADTFDGFRFAREREAHMAHDDLSKDVFKRQMISTAPDHLPFGTGKHACPGRFFAATELKAMFAHVVLSYDIAAEVEGVRPANENFAQRSTPNPKGKVLFRKRAVV